MRPVAIRQTGLISQALEVLSALGAYLRWPGDLLTLGRNLWMQVVRAPFDVDVPLPLKPVDPILADVAVRSYEIAVNCDLRAHVCLRCGLLFVEG